MTKLLHHGVWLAVCDGSKAMLLENTGDQEYPKLEKREVQEQSNPPARDLGESPPGRAFSGASGRRAAMDAADPHEQAEEAFLARFAARLDRLAAESRARIVIIAPPRALGLLRAHLAEATRRAVVSELARDYVKLPLYEIERHLRECHRV